MVRTWRLQMLLLAFVATLVAASEVKVQGIVQKRQNVGTGSPPPQVTATIPSSGSDSPSATPPAPGTTDDPTSDSPDPTPEPTPSGESPEPPNSPSPTPSPTPAPTSRSEEEPEEEPTPSPTPIEEEDTTTSTEEEEEREPTTFTSALVTSATEEFVTTFVTVVGSETIASALTTNRVFPTTTGFVTGTTTPSLNEGESGGSSGLSDSTKRIIGGVFGGVGGLLLIGGIAIVAWRMWGKRRRAPEDYDDDIGSGMADSVQREKHESGSAATPFQSTLDQYHGPGRSVNAAANF